ncbi:MAG TPA: FAD-dependent oxidoreductase [Elusimicrobiota bacterium]|nr:FAD-dependent oxidoreductase [Elusimicrobiota bacterium]
MKKSGEVVVIVGAGPAGLGAAWRLQQGGHDNFVVLEANSHPGGLSASFVDEKGFTWDLGGHVQFSHYPEYDSVLRKALGNDWLYHQRESWIWIHRRFVPYPFQYNFHLLGHRIADAVLGDLRHLAASSPRRPASNFQEWIRRTFGRALGALFMVPYNQKVWGVPLHRMSARWVGERVAVPDVERVARNVESGRTDITWGPNNLFQFPRQGGTGAIWSAVSRFIRSGRIQYGESVRRVFLKEHAVETSSGRRWRYDHLFNTMPLDIFCDISPDLAPRPRRAARRLQHGAVHVVGVGLRGGRPDSLRTKNWMYFPEPNSPYYRVTVFSNYSPRNVPPGPGHWSLMAEVTETRFKKVDSKTLVRDVLRALRQDRLIPHSRHIVDIWRRRVEHAYPTPTLERDELLGAILPSLEARSVFSRGRFGGWKYEAGNQDHCFMQGVEWAERFLYGKKETTYDVPERINARPPRKHLK